MRIHQRCSRRLIAAAVVVTFAPVVLAATQFDIAFSPKPQFASNSCRSYALAFAASMVPSSPVKVSTVSELRQVEADLQARIDATAKAMKPPFTSGSHQVWKRAIEEMSSGSLEVVIESAKTLDLFYSRVEALTGQGNVEQQGVLFSSALVRTPVMTSVTGIGSSNYGQGGHIVTVFGVASANENSSASRALAILNPAVKTADAKQFNCESTSVNDQRWSAVLSLEPAYSLKTFEGSGYVLMWIKKK